jgi:hypothetical protein
VYDETHKNRDVVCYLGAWAEVLELNKTMEGKRIPPHTEECYNLNPYHDWSVSFVKIMAEHCSLEDFIVYRAYNHINRVIFVKRYYFYGSGYRATVVEGECLDLQCDKDLREKQAGVHDFAKEWYDILVWEENKWDRGWKLRELFLKYAFHFAFVTETVWVKNSELFKTRVLSE